MLSDPMMGGRAPEGVDGEKSRLSITPVSIERQRIEELEGGREGREGGVLSRAKFGRDGRGGDRDR